jgi:hypothetical protein
MHNYLKELRLFRGPILKTYLLLTAPLLYILIEGVPKGDIVQLCLYSAHTILYLWFGWAVNDFSDRELDRASGKRRTFGIIRPHYAIAGIILLFITTLLIGEYLSQNPIYLLVLCTGLILGIIYSIPPFRLKGRGIWGLIFGPVYGKVIPILLATILFYRIEPWILIVLVSEGLKNGIDLLFHQIRDYRHDVSGGVKTFPVIAGLSLSINTLRQMTWVKIIAAGFLGCTLAWFVPEYRLILAAIVFSCIPAWFLMREFLIGNLQKFNSMTFIYSWFSEMIFTLSPLWLSIILALRYPPFIPFTLIIVFINMGLVRFYLKCITRLNKIWPDSMMSQKQNDMKTPGHD